ncbi:Fasciclin domain-containing protein [Pedobacter sp. ok626]|uniref:fasciclin domain-containing protein n=1 Tax=Pedobacter sp. ok626 TaxID=1761882 RepID=UPI00089028C3|nr:fasciclin domain-containing protein [Pedobacter sp. ok626]SDL94697.1 Fasciclin domain-containing protein [Pedobacter sp. ok626]
MKRNVKIMLLSLFSIFLCLCACNKDSLVRSTSNAVNMTQYLKSNPDDFSELTKVLSLSGTASFLNAYGSYTLFAPTNTAIKTYLQEKGKAAVEEISADDWKSFIRLHLLEDSIPTSRFTDGKLFNLTMFGQYLTTSSENVGGITKIRINRQANIVKSNISVGNGLIHSIDHVLSPATLSLAQTIEANPQYSIFTQALKETGLYDQLNILPANNPDEKKKWLTVIAETDEVFKAAGINSYAALKAKFSNTGNPKLATDSLHLFLDYHILYEAKYLADIITSSAHNTLAPLEVLTSKLTGETAMMNDDTFNGVYERGFSLLRDKSDVTTTNGVVHQSSAHFAIKLRSPYRVDFDVASFPELIKNTQYYKRQTYQFTVGEAAALTDVRFSGPEDLLIYRYGTGQSTSKTSLNLDVLVVPLAAGGESNRAEWVEFKTPLLIKGKYKVWIGYYTQQQGGTTTAEVQALIGVDGSIDRVPLSNPRILSFIAKRPGINKTVNGVTVIDAEAEEAIGFKTYMENTSGSQVAKLMGVADIGQTGRYWLRLKAINGKQTTNNIDMIQFIPINEDQQYPKYKPDGTKILAP